MHRERTLDVVVELHEDVANGLQLSLEYSALPDPANSRPGNSLKRKIPI
jgi:hypothetical protein